MNSRIPDLIAHLKMEIRGEVFAEPLDRNLYSTDASSYRILPACAVMPVDTGDISKVVQLAGQYGASIVPRGGGTSLSGQSVGPGIVVDLSRYMNQVIQINPEGRWVEVEAGITLGRLNAQLAPYGLKVGPDPSSGIMATIGGMIGNNSTGAHSILYGMMADHLKEVEVVLSDGSVVRFKPQTPEQLEAIQNQATLEAEIYRQIPALVQEHSAAIVEKYPKTWRNVAGYNLNYIHRLMNNGSSLNLTPLIAGSEGTLGVITRAKLSLVDIPKYSYLAVLHFDALRPALELVSLILEHQPSAVELVDDYLLALASQSPEWGHLLPNYFLDNPKAVLVVEFYGDTLEILTQRANALEQDLRAHQYEGKILHLANPIQMETLWNIRKAGAGILMSKRGDAKPLTFVDDATVPIKNLPDFVEEVVQICEKLDARAALIGHASAGCIHINPTLNTKTEAGIAKMRQLSESILQLAIRYEGSTTGEHGEGIARSYFNEQLYGEELHRAFRQVKGIFDPQNILNPGKIIDAPEPWNPEVIRLNPNYASKFAPTITWLDFSEDGGFAGAVEMCNGQGFCRKTQQGIMCPSYMATRDEHHSTRGRANALRAAISGGLGATGLINDDLYEVLDLCLECKACQRECPSRVDMTKLKSEFLAQYYQAKGIPLRSRLFAFINTLNWLSARPILRNLANWSFQNRFIRVGLEKTLGISAQRSLPSLAKQTFSAWYKQHARPNPEKPKVILWDDTFLTYNEPEIGIAAIRLLEAVGYQVEILQNHACCGRPMISKGLLAQAKKAAQDNVSALKPYLDQNIPIIGLEPSCVSAFRDEYPSLLRSEDAQKLAENTFFFEEFFSQALEKNPVQWRTPAERQDVYLHGHCHQRTLIGANTLVTVLDDIPNTTIHLIESGCCGMAGSFGYEQEHYELSLKIGEDRLFPLVRSLDLDSIVLASGTSCRHQIEDGTQRAALHPVIWMASHLP